MPTLEERISAFPRWHYEFDLGGVRTPILDPRWRIRHRERERYLLAPLLELFGGSLEGRRVLDLGCNAGFWSLRCAEAGAEHVVGVDGRAMHVEQANLVFEASGIDPSRYAFHLANVFETEPFGTFDIVLNLGLMYHVSKPMQLIELIAAHEPSVVVTDTAIVPGPGSVLALHSEPLDDPRNAADYELVMVPSAQAVVDLYGAFGYDTVVLAPRFESWEASEDFHEGRRRAFVSGRGVDLSGLDTEPVPAGRRSKPLQRRLGALLGR